ncbi:MAG: helix-turn-helix domain-containing protein [Tissierellia bacterium]|nr:helix-turn-helix domain-containing protein [Tissierellia bacterium]
MRREYLNSPANLPIEINFLKLKYYPLHWYSGLTIIWVLEGELMLSVESEKYTVYSREVEVINGDESFQIEAKSKEAKVLIFRFNPAFFKDYYEDSEDTFFYTNLPGDDIEDERYQELKKYLSELLFEYTYALEDYEYIISKTSVKLFFHLLNNFHYLFSEEESLREDEEKLAMYHRIVKYLSNNYMNNISLKDIAHKEFLSSPYLSSQIKETFGIGFKEYLNKIRVEEATKYLLDTKMNISRISEEVGFSHVRYFNKHFKLNYHMTPMEYRKKYRISDLEYENLKQFEKIDLEESIKLVQNYLLDYTRYDYDDRIVKISGDLNGESLGYFDPPEILDLGDASLYLENENFRILKEIQNNIGFKYAFVRNLFSADMDIYRGKNRNFINWTRVELLLETLNSLQLFPVIETKGVPKYILDDFLDNFSDIYEENLLNSYLDFDLSALAPTFLYKNIDSKNDELKMSSYILDKYINEGRRIIINPIDEIDKDTFLLNDTFFGGTGLFTNNGIPKASYFAYIFLAKLGGEIILTGEDFILTRKSSGFRLLIFNPYRYKSAKKRYSINISNLEHDALITRYELSLHFGSAYEKWQDLGSPERISNAHWEILSKYSYPDVDFSKAQKSGILNIVTAVEPGGSILYEIDYE